MLPSDQVVAIARTSQARYDAALVADALRDLFTVWGLDPGRAGRADWNPLADLIPPNSKVVLKPNWVLDYNQSGSGLDCLITHPAIIEAVLEFVALTGPASVVLGDAPVQGCDFGHLREVCGIDDMAARFRARGLPLTVVDFRRTVLRGRHLGESRDEGVRDLDRFVLFDLKDQSLLEALAADSDKLRVTMYDPDLLKRTHAPGRHQYLVAREAIEADVVINLPKLKSHKKSCLTGALKNVIGINGNKEFLPHHRKGGGEAGGDCYPGGSWWKSQAETVLDVANRRSPGHAQATLTRGAQLLARVAVHMGADANLEGSWYGNDTIWRTCLDLQRILRYGRLDGSLDSRPQRRVVSITDAIIGGEGEGPLANTPVPSRFLTAGLNTAAVEWVHARLMGFDPCKIPLVREAFGAFPYPLASFAPQAVRVRTASGEMPADEVVPLDGRSFLAAEGWRGHCESPGR